MSLIDKTYFFGSIALVKNDWDSIETFITEFEPRVLRELLGHELYNLVINNQNTEPYKSLINGKEYEVTYNGRTVKVKWNGLKNADKISLIAYYVYCYYLKQKATHISAVGAIKMKLENSDYANASNKIFSAWVKFSELYGDSNDSIIIPSAYNYLYENKDLFPEWEFTRKLVSMNGHGI